MTPYYADDHLTLYGGDCRAVLAELTAESVHTVVTSPPYWGLRDYGVGGQLGLEPTPEEYVANMVAVFREVRRVLRADGTLWLNLGDSYASTGGERTYGSSDGGTGRGPGTRRHDVPASGLKPKDLVGIPWRVAFALQADGWYLRSDIIWAKPNPMPEPVTDRPTKAHEYLFLLSKSARYYYDAEAVREGLADTNAQRTTDRYDTTGRGPRDGGNGGLDSLAARMRSGEHSGRNLRSVWNIATEPYHGAHFATFPRKLVEPCVKAGTSERGVCPECGAPWERVVKRGEPQPEPIHRNPAKRLDPGQAGHVGAGNMGFRASKLSGQEMAAWKAAHPDVTTGWRPTCAHAAEPVPAVVLDPFAGSGTTLLVAQALGRKAIGIDLNPDYLRQALDRNRQAPLGLVG